MWWEEGKQQTSGCPPTPVREFRQDPPEGWGGSKPPTPGGVQAGAAVKSSQSRMSWAGGLHVDAKRQQGSL